MLDYEKVTATRIKFLLYESKWLIVVGVTVWYIIIYHKCTSSEIRKNIINTYSGKKHRYIFSHLRKYTSA